ncbi:MAG: nucleotidyltransferase family protein [Xanthomonadales bacterium]|nr:nucleotidyltransferase family protein [Xanthomonadales bacterium]
MILAAGRGERLRPLTDDTPKALIDVNGKPLLQWHLENLARAGFTEVIINIAHLGEQIEAFAGNGERWGINIHYSRELEALETGGGIFKALPLLGDSAFLVINADIWTDYPLYKLRNHHCSHAHLVMVPNPKHNSEGDFHLNHGLIQADITSSPTEKLTFSGIGIYHPKLFADCSAGKYSLVPLLKTAMAAAKVTGEIFHNHWYDSGTCERLDLLRNEVSSVHQ